MKVGVISDVHSNKVALDAVLDDMPDDIDQLVCAGDIVGYNPWPSECLDRVREVCDVVVRGNHDRAVEYPVQYAGHAMAYNGLKIAKEQLSEEQLEWLQDQPDRTDFADGRMFLAHSHPDPDKRGEYVRPGDFPRLRRVLREQYGDEYEGVVIGHTHIQHQAVIDGKLILNPGSVGQPRDKNEKAAYAVLNVEDSITVDLRRVEYDIEKVQQAIRDAGLPDRTASRLSEGK